MQSYSLIAPAKINLYLEIIGDRPDGYHELAMILQSIGLADRIDVRANGTDQIRMYCDDPQVPSDESNLAYRAAALMAQEFPQSYKQFGGVDITIEKRIPIGAGLAGGSTDAAAVLVGMDLLWKLGLTQIEIQELAAMLGSDIPFCVTGGTAIATGRGEQLSPLTSPDFLYAVLAKYGDIAISTAWAYKTYRQQFRDSYAPDNETLIGRKQRVHSGAIVSAITQRDGKRIGQLLYNDLERVVLPTYPKVAKLRQTLEELDTLGVMMSGSGSTVFALVDSQAQAETVCQQLRTLLPNPDLNLWTTQLTASGIQLAH
ncbi:MAG: 4-(cytidine 5'-diphospho)-2-C-methyl-D-erythritol kinase [Cyanobacteria bacterium CRU_2_1]|nr:4-(cytidine 5'-diphospho)-2-C-methyl-D-erythritol kinase [Cyanobacteria bacterium RU_5_0]NJR58012.1 4-(cytidine 5'-diphospho)-2-C-methyl-D-erythritol kinase [Cyanobacteria bacterium CRU_2_1]